MQSYQEMSKEELLKEKQTLEAEYKKFQQRGLKLDMSRGKPSQEQLDISMGLMDVLASYVDLTCEDGTDCRNYGVLDGIQEVTGRYDGVQSGQHYHLWKLQLKYHV